MSLEPDVQRQPEECTAVKFFSEARLQQVGDWRYRPGLNLMELKRLDGRRTVLAVATLERCAEILVEMNPERVEVNLADHENDLVFRKRLGIGRAGCLMPQLRIVR